MERDRHGLPELFLERLRRLVPPGQWSSTVRSFAQRKPTTFRVNTLKASAREVYEQLTREGFGLERVGWYADAFILRRGQLRELQASALYQHGAIYVQSLASMLPPLLLDPQPGESVLDLTAAPGSKTTQIACLMQGRGRILANDNNRVRFYKLRANVAHQGAENVECTMQFGETVGKRYPGAFDRVLVDAPCSAEGRFLTSEPKSLGFWKLSKVHEMARKQRRLLESGIAALRPGGVLVYSTCTFAPEENEGVIQHALQMWKDAVTLEPMTLTLSNASRGLVAWEDDRLDPSLTRTMRILPTDEMEGFFIARLRKK